MLRLSLKRLIACFLPLLLVAQLLSTASAFVPSNSVVPDSSRTDTIGSRHSSSTELSAVFPRRVLFQWVRRTFLAGATWAASNRQPSLAAELEDGAAPGKVVQFEVANLNGSEGGTVKIQLYPEWAPRGVERFEELTENGFYNDARFFRVLPGFVVQFGINGNPSTQAKWRSASIPDDPVRVSNKRGTVVFATAGPNSRTTQIFVNTRKDGNDFLDRQGFAPFGKIIEGMDLIDKCYAGYGEGAPSGNGPNQGLIQLQGNAYLKEKYPKLSFISKASLL